MNENIKFFCLLWKVNFLRIFSFVSYYFKYYNENLIIMKVFPITDIPEFSKKERIVVVGVIGKSPYRYPNKTTPLLPSVQSKEVSFRLDFLLLLLI